MCLCFPCYDFPCTDLSKSKLCLDPYLFITMYCFKIEFNLMFRQSNSWLRLQVLKLPLEGSSDKLIDFKKGAVYKRIGTHEGRSMNVWKESPRGRHVTWTRCMLMRRPNKTAPLNVLSPPAHIL